MRRATYFPTGAISAIVARGAIASAYSAQGAIIPARGGIGGSISSGGYTGWVGRTIGYQVGMRGGFTISIRGSGEVVSSLEYLLPSS
eukprot:15366013-Ditylum_brightwellii.AAC.1